MRFGLYSGLILLLAPGITMSDDSILGRMLRAAVSLLYFKASRMA